MAMDKREESTCVCIGCLEPIDKANAIETKPWHWYHTQCVKPIKKPKVYLVSSLTQLLIKASGLGGKAYSS